MRRRSQRDVSIADKRLNKSDVVPAWVVEVVRFFSARFMADAQTAM
jgi:hypothetical protein